MSRMTLSESLLERIRAEFLRTEGLRVTPWQAQQLWRLGADECLLVLQRLVQTRFLREEREGSFVCCRPKTPVERLGSADSHV